MAKEGSAEDTIRTIKRKTRRKYSGEEKIRIVLEGLLKLLLVRVWAKDGQIVSLCLRPDFHITAGLDATRPTELTVDLEDDSYRSGSDGDRQPACMRSLMFFPRHVAQSYFCGGDTSVAVAA
jgi:hypothetical protein